MRLRDWVSSERAEKVYGLLTWFPSGPCMHLSPGCLLELGTGIQPSVEARWLGGVVCEIHKKFGEGVVGLQLVICFSTRYESKGLDLGEQGMRVIS